jgi:hypothetical protein
MPRRPANNLSRATSIGSGAIDAKDIGRLRAAGVKHAINSLTEQESQGLNESQITSGLRMVHLAIPIQEEAVAIQLERIIYLRIAHH